MNADEPVFDLIRPDVWSHGVIFASPHSGRSFPAWFLKESRLTEQSLRSSEDAYIDQLIAPARASGAAILTSRIPRSVVDLNRNRDEIDPLVVADVPQGKLNSRIMAGLGVIPRVVSQGRPIYNRLIPKVEAERRIEAFWTPYHRALGGLIDEAIDRFGGALLIDVHSMPRDALAHLPAPRPEIVVGDRNGGSASKRVSDEVIDTISGLGYRVRRNSPFSGAYITAAYGRPAQNVHVVQVEIDRSLYMDEQRIAPRADFAMFALRFSGLVAKLASIRPGDSGVAMAAE